MRHPVTPDSADLVAHWRKAARSVLPESAQALAENGWDPTTADRLVTSLTGDYCTMPMLMNANDLVVAASHLTKAVPALSAEDALLCARAGLGPAETSALHTTGHLDRSALAAMAALRAQSRPSSGPSAMISA